MRRRLQLVEPPRWDAIAAEPLWERYEATGSDEDRNALATAYFDFVRWAAWRVFLKFPAEDYDDLLCDASPALLRAVEGFDRSKGFKFTTYAGRAVWTAMKDGIEKRQTAARLAILECDLHGISGNPLESIAVAADDDEDTAAAQLEFAGQLWSLALSVLSSRDAHVMASIYRRGLTYREIGEELGVSKERVRQLMARALATVTAASDTVSFHPLTEAA